MLKFALWVRKKFQQTKRLRFEKWFKFPPWSTQRKIGRLLPSATMDHCGFITVHGRESRIYRKLLIDRANKLDFASKRHDHCASRQMKFHLIKYKVQGPSR